MEWGALAAEEQVSHGGPLARVRDGVKYCVGGGMGERSWVKEIGKQLREDMGDCPTLPKEMLDVLRKLDILGV